MLIRTPRRRRLALRRTWALGTLRLHVEVEGACEFCTSRYGVDSRWPCRPAQVTMLYAGRNSLTSTYAANVEHVRDSVDRRGF